MTELNPRSRATLVQLQCPPMLRLLALDLYLSPPDSYCRTVHVERACSADTVRLADLPGGDVENSWLACPVCLGQSSDWADLTGVCRNATDVFDNLEGASKRRRGTPADLSLASPLLGRTMDLLSPAARTAGDFASGDPQTNAWLEQLVDGFVEQLALLRDELRAAFHAREHLSFDATVWLYVSDASWQLATGQTPAVQQLLILYPHVSSAEGGEWVVLEVPSEMYRWYSDSEAVVLGPVVAHHPALWAAFAAVHGNGETLLPQKSLEAAYTVVTTAA